MNLIKPLTALVSLLALVPKLLTGAASIVRAARGRPPVVPIPFGRPHAWGYGLSEPPRCVVCRRVYTKASAAALCDGPPPHEPPPGAT